MITELIAAAALMQATASPAAPLPDDDWLRDATIRRMDFVLFHQTIDEENVDRVARLLGPEDILDLQSEGGEMRAGLRFAELVRERRVRVRVTGECLSGCALVWAVAHDRLDNGFVGVTFRDNPIGAWSYAVRNPRHFSPAELSWIEGEQLVFRAFVERVDLQPWLFECAHRLQNIRPDPNPMPGQPRLPPAGEYSRVWFPASILTRAGVRGLDRYDAPNARQRQAIETQQGTRRVPLKVYWAQDGDCDPDIAAAAAPDTRPQE